MPLFGTLDVAASVKGAPAVTNPGRDVWASKAAEILNFTFELDMADGFPWLPPAMHPAIPAFAGVMFRKHEESPAGPFTMAELRITGRAGIHYAGYSVGGFCDNPDAIKFLGERYGWNLQEADVAMEPHYFGIQGIVKKDGVSLFDGMLESPHYISGSDVLYTPNLNLGTMDGVPWLVQVEYDFEFEKAQRGKPVITTFDADAFGDGRVVFTQPLPATHCVANMKFHEVCYRVDPMQPAIVGTQTIDGEPVAQPT